MATGGQDDADFASEEAYDWTCSQCQDGGKTIEAIAYCCDCKEGYCDPCLKIHSRFPAMKTHKIMDASQRDGWGNMTSSVRGSSQTCPDHEDQTLSMYCGDHGTVCCPVCVALDHSMCSQKGYIPKISAGIADSPEYLDTQTAIQTKLNDTDAVLNEVKAGKDTLTASKHHVTEDLREIKKQVVDLFDDLEEDALAELGKASSTVESKLEVALSMGKEVHSQLQSLSEMLKSDANVCESDMFINMKRCQRDMKDVQSVTTISEALKGYEITFTEHPFLQKLQGLSSLGKVEEVKLYSLRNEYECMVISKEDKYVGPICGMLILANGELLLSDQANRAIKRYDSSYNMIDRCPMPGPPSQLCSTDKSDTEEVAVALISNKVQFITVDDTIKQTKIMRLTHKCNGIAYYAGKFYISDSSRSVYIYTYDGKLLATVYMNQEGEPIFKKSQAISITASSTGGVVYVGDYARGIITLDLDGNYISTLSCRETGSCSKVCCDNHGNILTVSEHVTQIGGHGKSVLATFANNAEHMFLDTQLSTLYVLTKEGDDLFVTHKLKVYAYGKPFDALS